MGQGAEWLLLWLLALFRVLCAAACQGQPWVLCAVVLLIVMFSLAGPLLHLPHGTLIDVKPCGFVSHREPPVPGRA